MSNKIVNLKVIFQLYFFSVSIAYNAQHPVFIDSSKQNVYFIYSFLLNYSLFWEVLRANQILNACNSYLIYNIGYRFFDSSPLIQYNKRTLPLF